jgi:diphthamide biosynthesis methyltransferase
MFYVIGLGLCDEKDITIRGLEVILFFFYVSQQPSLISNHRQ